MQYRFQIQCIVGWLFWVLRALGQDSNSVYIGPSAREREEKREMIGEGEIFKQPPAAPTASTVGPFPSSTQISRTPRP